MIPNKCELLDYGKTLRVWNFPAEDTAVDKPVTEAIKGSEEYQKAAAKLPAGPAPVVVPVAGHPKEIKPAAEPVKFVFGAPKPTEGTSGVSKAMSEGKKL